MKRCESLQLGWHTCAICRCPWHSYTVVYQHYIVLWDFIWFWFISQQTSRASKGISLCVMECGVGGKACVDSNNSTHLMNERFEVSIFQLRLFSPLNNGNVSLMPFLPNNSNGLTSKVYCWKTQVCKSNTVHVRTARLWLLSFTANCCMGPKSIDLTHLWISLQCTIYEFVLNG